MRRLGWLSFAFMVAPLLVASCAQLMDVDMAAQTILPSEQPATTSLSGPAVEDGLLCAEATVRTIEWEDDDGNAVTYEEYLQLMERGRADGTRPIRSWHDEFTCTDGSGSFVLEVHPKVSPAEYDHGGSTEIGEWSHSGGTGPYDQLAGNGEVTIDFVDGSTTFTGVLSKT